ncbi:MAG: protein kinase [Acidobacteriota bacterium]|nr:protein kinase [Acidobacteriota bacterium]
MICPKCQTENDAANEFCNECGTRLSTGGTQNEFRENPPLEAKIPKPADEAPIEAGVSKTEQKTEVLPASEVNSAIPAAGKKDEIPPTRIFGGSNGGAGTSPLHGNESSALLGRVIDNRYRLDAFIGDGGMGYVFRATRLQLGDAVAIKILHPKNCGDSESVERFRREAQAAARLKHQNAVFIYDSGVTADDNLCYIVMELLEGVTLRQIMRESGVLPPAQAVEIVSQIASALDQAHQLGIIHRDLKPENIFVQNRHGQQQIKILDFGIAKICDVQQQQQQQQVTGNLTKAGFAVGTPRYMSPEQCLGEELDRRSDIYSLGIIAYEMLTGIVPFNSPTDGALYTQHISQPPPPLRSINLGVPVMAEQVVLRALDKNRAARPQSAGQFAQELRAAITANNYPSYESQTVVTPLHTYQTGNTSAHHHIAAAAAPAAKSSKLPYVLLGVLSVVLLGILAYMIVPGLLKKNVVVPDHFGLFNRSRDDRLTALRFKEFNNLLKGRDELKEDSSLPTADTNPNLILYSDQQTIPSVDLKLIKLDTIKDDGSIENWEYQIAPVDGNPEMKQIKVRSGLPKGRYALALLKGNADEGTHKLWAFQVENGAENPAEAQKMALTLKPTPAPTPTPQVITKTVTVPSQTEPESAFSGPTGVCWSNDVRLRSAPTQNSAVVGKLARGQRVAKLNYSSNMETFKGVTAGWYYVQTSNGTTGWVFAHYIR